MAIKENDIVMCTVKSIEGTTVFVQIEDNGSGSIVFSEIAAGRIRNIREYVSPNKKIVCKVLKIYPDHTELSLRRVTGKEREEIQLRFKNEKTFSNMLKANIKDSENVIKGIREKYELWDFYEKVKEDGKILENFMKKADSDLITKLLQEKKDREKIVKKTVVLKSDANSGINDIKDILKVKGVKIHYLGSSQFSIDSTAKNYKDAEHELDNAIKQIEIKAKEKKMFFELKEK
jgi:translation initiation factor 2 alpha subunit (eIF-2alpha)